MHKAQAVQVRYREHNLGSVQPRQRFIKDALQQTSAPFAASLCSKGPAYGSHLEELLVPRPQPFTVRAPTSFWLVADVDSIRCSV